MKVQKYLLDFVFIVTKDFEDKHWQKYPLSVFDYFEIIRNKRRNRHNVIDNPYICIINKRLIYESHLLRSNFKVTYYFIYDR